MFKEGENRRSYSHLIAVMRICSLWANYTNNVLNMFLYRTTYIVLVYPHHPTTPSLTKVPPGSATNVDFQTLPLLHLEISNQILTTSRLTALHLVPQHSIHNKMQA